MGTAPFSWPRSVLAWVIGACVGGLPIGACAGEWTITPRAAAQEIYTDNVLLTSTNRRSDFITTLSPGIAISGDSARLQAKLDYSPLLQAYALTPGQDVIGHNLYANGTATIVPDLFFFDARGYASLLPNTAGLSTGLTPFLPSTLGPSFTNLSQGLPKAQLSQVFTATASPYLAQRFDGFGTGMLRYTVTDTSFGGGQSTTATPTGVAVQNTNALTNEATAAFFTGENFGRYEGRLLLDAAQSNGTGGVNHADQNVALVESAYAITHNIAALGTIGYEQIHFGGVPPTQINDVVWGLGTRLTPSAEVTLVLSYGRRNGVTSPFASLIYNIAARTTLSASYSEGLSTVDQQIANDLAISDLNQQGQTINRGTLLPLSIGNPVLGLQGGLFRSKQLNGIVRSDLERDHFIATIYRTEDLVVAQSTAGSSISQRATGVAVSWSRELSRLTTASLGVGYTRSNLAEPANTEEGLLNIAASITYLLSPTLTGWASYYFFDRNSPQPQSRVLSNIVLVGVSKTF
jgi:uncharacterized protein (PEP-CTERM system associated)